MFNWQIKIIAAIVIVGALFGAYHWVGSRAVDQYKLTEQVKQNAANAALQDKYDELSANYEVLKASKKTFYKTIYKTVDRVVEKPIYNTQCIDSEGVEVANKALAGGKDELF